MHVADLSVLSGDARPSEIPGLFRDSRSGAAKRGSLFYWKVTPVRCQAIPSIHTAFPTEASVQRWRGILPGVARGFPALAAAPRWRTRHLSPFGASQVLHHHERILPALGCGVVLTPQTHFEKPD